MSFNWKFSSLWPAWKIELLQIEISKYRQFIFFIFFEISFNFFQHFLVLFYAVCLLLSAYFWNAINNRSNYLYLCTIYWCTSVSTIEVNEKLLCIHSSKTKEQIKIPRKRWRKLWVFISYNLHRIPCHNFYTHWQISWCVSSVNGLCKWIYLNLAWIRSNESRFVCVFTHWQTHEKS